MVYTIDELKSKIAPIAERYNIPAVYLFGSYARGEATDDSDVDVLFQRSGSTVRGMLIGGLYNDLCESLDKEIDLITEEALDQPDVQRRTPWFKENLQAERLLIYERQ